MINVLITGGTGLIGKILIKKLQTKGYNVSVLTRNADNKGGVNSYYWNPDNDELDINALENADYIIHLAGANIAEKRWSNDRKKIILDSRVKSAELIYNKLKIIKNKPKAFISASAIGYYGAITTSKIFSEQDGYYNDFLGNICKKWEDAADNFETLGVRTVKLRTGVVLTKEFGALDKMIKPTRLGLGAAIGTGKQYLPWIHIDDLCDIYIKAIEDDDIKGAYNAVAPDYKTNKEFMYILAKVLNKSFWLPNIPSFVIKLIFGEMSKMILEGSRVSSDKILSKYKFKFTNLELALKNLL